MDFIFSLGAQGELVFIEGLTKDSNILIRSLCAKGLALIGASTLRTLLVGLYDESSIVRGTVEKEILENFSFEDIFRYFESKDSHKQSLKIAIRDILEKNIPLSGRMIRYLEDLLIELEKDYLYNRESSQQAKYDNIPKAYDPNNQTEGLYNNGNNLYEEKQIQEQFPYSESDRIVEHS